MVHLSAGRAFNHKKKKKQAGGFDENVHLRKQTATPAPEFQQQPKAAKWNLIIQKKNSKKKRNKEGRTEVAASVLLLLCAVSSSTIKIQLASREEVKSERRRCAPGYLRRAHSEPPR